MPQRLNCFTTNSMSRGLHIQSFCKAYMTFELQNLQHGTNRTGYVCNVSRRSFDHTCTFGSWNIKGKVGSLSRSCLLQTNIYDLLQRGHRFTKIVGAYCTMTALTLFDDLIRYGYNCRTQTHRSNHALSRNVCTLL
jgi:hypothetical protein